MSNSDRQQSGFLNETNAFVIDRRVYEGWRSHKYIPPILTDRISTCKIPHHRKGIAQRDGTLQSTLC
jgi:hypothetical protein